MFKIGKRGSGLQIKLEDIQNFERLRDQCLQKGTLFEDPTFKAVNSSLYFSKAPDKKLEWRRPGEITKEPRFFIDGMSRFDVKQGNLGDCWFVAALATLTLNKTHFHQVVPKDQEFDSKYAGIFHFRFWQYGKWVDVVIDDRLPTFDGKLEYIQSAAANEFWSALLEKAYAKLYGSYEDLVGGFCSEALEDFTGGISEIYMLNEQQNIFKIMSKAFQRQSLMCGSIFENDDRSCGIYGHHAYSITSIACVNTRTAANTTCKMSLVRIRNPWGNDDEWNGPWSDESSKWPCISDLDKKSLGLKVDADGEFWMCYNDFAKYFSRIDICHLNPDFLSKEQLGEDFNKRWKISVFEGAWVRDATAGGCRAFLDTFASNPQYRIKLEDVDDDDDEHKCTVIIALMQKSRRAHRKLGDKDLSIGFDVYQVRNPDNLPKLLGKHFFKNTTPTASIRLQKNREVIDRFNLFPGTYCIVPSTSRPNEQGEFILRVFSENPNNMTREHHYGEIDDEIELNKNDLKHKGRNSESNNAENVREDNKGSFFSGLVSCIRK